MIDLVSIIALGFFLGMRHATDADHVIAVTTIVSRERTIKLAAWIGVLWGFGHTVTIFLVGAAIILFRWVIPARVGLTMEFSVGLMLILLGLLTLKDIMRRISESAGTTGPPETFHSHPHRHGDYVHSHPHSHAPEVHQHPPLDTPLGKLDKVFGRLGAYQIVRPFVVGVVHGLAGSAAIALLVLTTIRDPRWAIAYLLVFGLGTIAGMMLITAAVALPFAYTTRRFAQFNRALRLASGLLSLAFGIFLAYQVGFVNGLFTGHPHWSPR
jgi:ABC-type nickel/cobalt efflux system permease component RcnA